MATQTGFCSFKISNLLDRTRIHSRTILFLLTVSLLMGVARRVEAQTPPQQHVYGAQSLSPTSSRVSGFSKASQTGALTVVPGSPFNERFEGGLVAIDGQGKFLFVLNPTSNDISMFQIDQATGALAEVPASPFQVPPTVNPNQAPSFALSIGTEASGKFVFVGYAFGDFQGQSAVVTLSIDTSVPTNPALLTQQTTDFLVGEPLQLLTDGKGLHLYVGLSQGQDGQLVGGADVYSIDPAAGSLSFLGTADGSAGLGRSTAIDPAGRFFFVGWGFHIGFIDSCIISPVDGTTAALPSSTVDLGPNPGIFPDAMVVDNSGRFLFVQQTGIGVLVYSIDQITGALSHVQGPFANISFSLGTAVADPQGPYLYSLDTLGIHAYQIDQQIGNLAEISGSPFSDGVNGSPGGLAISGSPVQAVTGPAATIFPTTANFGSITVGTSSPTQVFSIVDIGGQTLNINSISITGTDASSFSQSNTCTPTLAPNASCSVSVTFTPASAGPLSATLQVSDNAPGSPQTLVLNGTGVAAAPAVTLLPGSLDFGTVTQGTSISLNSSVKNSGAAPLHITSVVLGGTNPNDFNVSSPACNTAIAVNSTCTITVTFVPLAPGVRSANITISDDAPDSPQTLALSGTSVVPVAGITFNPAVPSFPTITQGTSGLAQILTITNSGTGPLHISSVSLGGPNPLDFSFTNNCQAPVAPSANCTISLVFNPVVSAQSTANLTITDDAAGSPQSISLSASANPAFTPGPAPNGGSTTASISAGQTAQYLLQLTPGPGYSGTVSLACTGAPLDATCQVPASVSIANGASAPFTVTVSTKGGAALPPSIPKRFVPPSGIRALPLLAFALLLLIIGKSRSILDSAFRARRLARSGGLAAILLCSVIYAAGCGSSVTTTPTPVTPPAIVTPSGTSAIIITLTAMSSSGQPLQLPTLQLTLTVK